MKKAASTKWNFIPATPGLVGGHCIAVDYIQFGFLFKSDFEAFKKIVLHDIKFRDYEDDYKYEMYGTASPIYKIYIDNDKETSSIIQKRLEEFYAKYDVRLIYCRL